jgi:hypothetical protein
MKADIKRTLTLFWTVSGLVLLNSCQHKNPATPQTNLEQFTAELAWENAVDLDLFIVDPYGQVWDRYESPADILFAGDNQCGFGPQCNQNACGGYLPCGTHEAITVTAPKKGIYTLWVNSWATLPETITLEVVLPEAAVNVGEAYEFRFECQIPAETEQAIANLQFTAGQYSIEGMPADRGFALCQITQQRLRTP